jgi:hypothetical protein
MIEPTMLSQFETLCQERNQVMSQADRTQTFPDGTRVLMPESQRFVIVDGQWCWMTPTQGLRPLFWLRTEGRLEWQSCCAVAAELFRLDSEQFIHVRDGWRERQASDDANAKIWQAEFAKAALTGGKEDR